ncbi:MAG: hypothetical protein V1831_02925 [Candidatus Woesearchaeota archaeon]
MFNKKAMFISPADFFKGLVIGFIIGAVLVYLGVKGVISIPFL